MWFSNKAKSEETAGAILLALLLTIRPDMLDSVGSCNGKEGVSEKEANYCGCFGLKWL